MKKSELKSIIKEVVNEIQSSKLSTGITVKGIQEYMPGVFQEYEVSGIPKKDLIKLKTLIKSASEGWPQEAEDIIKKYLGKGYRKYGTDNAYVIKDKLYLS